MKAIHASYLVTQEPFSALDPGIVRFLIAIEHVFLHGLKWGLIFFSFFFFQLLFIKTIYLYF